MKFQLGQIVITVGAKEEIPIEDVQSALDRYVEGDWGDVPKEDWNANNKALKNDDRLLSSYKSNEGIKFWIITEWDRSYTTVLLPSEY